MEAQLHVWKWNMRLDNRRILIVSYLFPPVGGIGVQRALSLAKYLPQSGYEVHILKSTNAGGPVHDPDLLRQVPPQVRVHEAFSPEIPFALRQKLWARISTKTAQAEHADRRTTGLLAGAVKRILCPEPEILWVPFAIRRARRIIQKHKIGFVLITVPPFSALIVGTVLKRAFPSIRLISDFRDEWLSFYVKDFDFQNNDYTRRRAAEIERDAVKSSDLIVAVNKSSRDEIRRRYPDQRDNKFLMIPNGFDTEVFARFKARPHQLPRMIVTHVGTVYKTASPRFYLNALDQIPEEQRQNIETRFIGRISDSENTVLQNRNHFVNVFGFMSQSEALRYMEETDYLLLTMTNEISVPGKLYEYLAAGKPILAITPRGSEVDQILRQTGAGLSAAPDDAGGIIAMLSRAFHAWRDHTAIVWPDVHSVRLYERRRLVGDYAKLIDGLRSQR